MPLFKIDKDSIIDTKGGYKYCGTIPPHPHGEKRDDRNIRYVYLHRALMELKLNRYLKSEEHVNHKDENPSNNALSNLELVSNEDHQQGHALKRKFWKKSPRNKPGRKAAMRVIERFLLS